VVRGSSPIRTLADLRGKRVALCKWSVAHSHPLLALDLPGLTHDDIKIVYLPDSEDPIPRAHDGADGWLTWDPFLSDLQMRGGYRTVADGTGLVPNHRFYLARRDFADAMPDVVTAIIDEATRVGAAALQSPATMAHLVASAFSMHPDVMEKAIRRLPHGARKLDRAVMQKQELIADCFWQMGLLPQAISVADAMWP
jgi:sulfonate transport system substrate-binding protein